MERNIRYVKTVQHTQQSPTHKVGLVIEPGNWVEHDPFLILAEDWFQKGTFDLHPHRGIETVTYVIEGRLEHFDNKAGKGELLPGDVQWMTAGSGVIHSEDPVEGETVHSLQLWVNLSSDKKMTVPRYQNMKSKDMPVYEKEGALIRVFSGTSNGIQSLTQNHTAVTFVEMNVEAGAEIRQELPGDYNGFMYVLEGQGTFGSNHTEGRAGQALFLEKADTLEETYVTVRATQQMKVLLYAGQPIKEPVVARGPFVMNTEEEVRQAYKDYTDGKFI
jgi:quercetin 2,3-dioxygenase